MRTDPYHVMHWKFGPKTPGICALGSWKSVYTLPYFYACESTYPEKAEVWTFTQKKDMEFANHIKVSFEKYPPDPNWLDHTGYQLPCVGDSGGGHWRTGGEEATRQVLIGIHVTGDFQCGKSGYMEKINNKEAIRWIKSHYLG